MYLVIELINSSRWSLHLKVSRGKSVVRDNYRDGESVLAVTKAPVSDCTCQHTRDTRHPLKTSSIRLMILPAFSLGTPMDRPQSVRWHSDASYMQNWKALSWFGKLTLHKVCMLYASLLLFSQDPQSFSSSSDLQCYLCSVTFLWIPVFTTQGIWFITWEYNLRHNNMTFRMAEWKDTEYNEAALTCCRQKVADVPAGEGSPSQQCSVELRTQWERTRFLN